MKKLLAVFLFVLVLVACPMPNTDDPTPPEPVVKDLIYVKSSGDNNNSGTEGSPVATIEKAIALLPSGGTIWVMDTIGVGNPATWDGGVGISIKRYGGTSAPAHTGALVNVTGGTLTLANITIDGQGGINNLGGTVEAIEALIKVNGGTLHLGSGTILQNNKNTSTTNHGGGVLVADNATFTIFGGTISNNTATNGGGVYVSENGTLNLTSGTAINISGNTKTGGGVNNIAYTNTVNSSPVKVTDSIIVANGTKIGLSPTSTNDKDMLVQKLGGAIIPANFSLDTATRTLATDGGGNLIIPMPIYVKSNGDNNNSGLENSPVATIEKAISLLAGGGDILVMDTQGVSNSATWDGGVGITIKRYSGNSSINTPAHTGALVNVTGGTHTLANITIDGQGGIIDTPVKHCITHAA